MDTTTFHRVRERLASGVNHDSIYRILEAAAAATHAKSSALIEYTEDSAEIITAYGFSLFSKHTFRQEDPFFQTIIGPTDGLDRETGAYVIRVPLQTLGEFPHLAIICWNINQEYAPTKHIIGVIRHLGTAISHQLNMLGDAIASSYYKVERYRVAEEVAAYVAEEDPQILAAAEGSAIVSQFLLDTLVKKRRMMTRDNIMYHSIRRWRAPIKEWQITALRAIKQSPPPQLVTVIAEELMEEAECVVGVGVIRSVAAVPCGHSGPQCLAHRIAQALAELLNVPHTKLFEPIPVKGKSHPKANVKRPPMHMIGKPTGPVLLVDDVATSGSHIVEAAKLIRSTGSVVVPIAWISSSSEAGSRK